MSRHPERRRALPALIALAGIAALSACSPVAAPAVTTAPAPVVTTSEAAVPTIPAAPALMPDGSAEENLPFFASVVEGVWGSGAGTQGRAYIDALVAAGFDKAAMQVTHDTSTVGNEAESIQFSVLWGDQCLVGQVGSATGEPFATVVPALGSGGCLVGATRSIDW